MEMQSQVAAKRQELLQAQKDLQLFSQKLGADSALANRYRNKINRLYKEHARLSRIHYSEGPLRHES